MEGNKFIVEVERGKLFGPQPYLAIKTIDSRYLHDNFDIQIPMKKFSYTFDFNTIDIKSLSEVSAASADKYGNYSIVKLEIK